MQTINTQNEQHRPKSYIEQLLSMTHLVSCDNVKTVKQ